MLESIRKEAKKVRFVGNEARLENYDIGELKSDEILVKTKCSLISIGTETTALTGRWDSLWFRDNPGYALAGDVIEVGADVKDFKVGDRVFSEKNHCNYGICKTTPHETMKIPKGVAYEEAIFCSMTAVALHSIRRAEMKIGESVVIFGAGIIGILNFEMAKRSGAHPIIFIDLSSKRLDFVKELGADYVINASTENIKERVIEYAGKDGADIVIEAVGNPNILQSCMSVCASGGRVVSLGALAGEIAHLDLFTDFITRELSLVAAQQPMNPTEENIYYHFTKVHEREYILGLMQRKELDVKRLITHRYDYTRIPEVYEILKNGKNADYDEVTHQARDMIGVMLMWR
ncbi:MAG: zinc-dependent alcohol dehydrogenase [Saccharofermentanales bacterium]